MTDWEAGPPLVVCPVQGCSLPVDIIIKSSDGRLLGAHSTNLSAYSEGFPPACFASPETISEPVELSEKAEVIEVMLKYMHNTRLARLEDCSPTQVWDIAYAAEKYLIYPLMEVCRLHIKFRFSKDDPKKVLAYAVEHDYDDLFDDAVPRTIDWELNDAYVAMGATPYFVAWVRYREEWLKVREVFRIDPPVVLHKGGMPECSLWPEFVMHLLKLDISELPTWKPRMNQLREDCLRECSWCHQRAVLWMNIIVNRYAHPIPKASTLK